MIELKPLLHWLTKPEVAELKLTSGKKAEARSSKALEIVSPDGLSTGAILDLLVYAGGSRHVDALGPRPTVWSTRIEGIGPLLISAIMLGDDVQAVIRRREVVEPREPRDRRSSVDPPSPALANSSQRPRQEPPSSSTPIARIGKGIAIETGRSIDAGRPERGSDPGSSGRAADVGRDAAGRSIADTMDRRVPELPRARPDPELIRPTRKNHRVAPARTVPRPPMLDDADVDLDRAALTPRTASEIAEAARVEPSSRPARSAEEMEAAGWANTLPASTTPTREKPTLRPSAGPPIVIEPSRPPRERHEARWIDLLRSARDRRASDLLIVASRKPLLRTSGVLVPSGDVLDPSVVEDMLLARVPDRLLATLDRDGACDFALEEPSLGRFRVNVARQRTGYFAALRLIPAEVPTIASLGLPDAIASAARHHQGLIVITGPTGHGKTTSLAALVDHINRERACHVLTIEDPVEHVHPRKKALVSQREVGTHTRSFHSALRASLREDPDVIAVGELRDTETVQMALSAGETGHLVIGTMNTPSASKTIDRLIDLFPPGEQQQVRVTLAASLRLIVSQRLVPRASGDGMVAAVELLPGLPALANLIRDNKTFQIPSLQQRGKGLGIMRLDDSLAELVRAGMVTLEAAAPFAESPDELAANARRTPDVAPRPNDKAPPAQAAQAVQTGQGKGIFGSLFKRGG